MNTIDLLTLMAIGGSVIFGSATGIQILKTLLWKRKIEIDDLND